MTTPSREGQPSNPMSVGVLGGGWYGIAAAKTWLQFDPSVDLTLIAAESGIGGVWSADRIYPGLVADSPAGLFEFSDMQMAQELGVDEWADITGQTVQQYLERYARKFGILQRCRFNTTVLRVERHGTQWAVHVQAQDASAREILCYDKVVIATGINSRPQVPSLPSSNFSGTVIHSKDLGKIHPSLTSTKVNHVVIVGGNKSAVEAATLCATAGKQVSWLIRKGGKGPGILFTTRNKNGRHRAADGAARWSGIFRPGLYAARSWIHRFFYDGKSWLGTWLCKRAWKAMTRMMLASHQSTHPNRKLLNPETTDFFWPLSGVSFLHDNAKELMKLVEDGDLIHVYRETITSLSDDSVQLSNGQSIEADVIILATGWRPSQSVLFDTSTANQLGLPIAVSEEGPEEAAYWHRLQVAGDEEVFDLYPILRHPPRQPAPRTTTPHRLFRTIAPPNLAAQRDCSLAFVGLISNNQISSHAEISALWAVAYLTGRIYETPIREMLSDRSKMDQEIATMNAFMERRYLGRKEVPDAAMEIQDYTDLMMRDLGLRDDRKRMHTPTSWLGFQGWKAEYFEPYMPRDYIGVVEEFLNRYPGHFE